MKKNKNIRKIAIGILATSAILSLGITSTYAYGGGHGNGQGQGNGRLSQYVTSDEKAKMQSLSGDERTAYMNQLKEKYNVSQGQGQNQGQNRKQDSSKYGQKGQGQGNNYGQGQRKGQNQEHGNHGKDHDSSKNMSNLISDIPASDLNETEKTLLIKG